MDCALCASQDAEHLFCVEQNVIEHGLCLVRREGMMFGEGMIQD